MPARAKSGRGEPEGRRKKDGIAAAHWFAGRDGRWMCPKSSTDLLRSEIGRSETDAEHINFAFG